VCCPPRASRFGLCQQPVRPRSSIPSGSESLPGGAPLHPLQVAADLGAPLDPLLSLFVLGFALRAPDPSGRESASGPVEPWGCGVRPSERPGWTGSRAAGACAGRRACGEFRKEVLDPAGRIAASRFPGLARDGAALSRGTGGPRASRDQAGLGGARSLTSSRASAAGAGGPRPNKALQLTRRRPKACQAHQPAAARAGWAIRRAAAGCILPLHGRRAAERHVR
jgi:hypothetical protein